MPKDFRRFDDFDHNFDHNFDRGVKTFGCAFFAIWILSAAASIGFIIFICWFLVQLLGKV